MTIAWLAIAFSLAGSAPHADLPSTFVGGRVFAMPQVANSIRRMVLWLDTDGSGFIRASTAQQLALQTTVSQGQAEAYLPKFSGSIFPPISDNHGALPILLDSDVANDPVFAGIDGQLCGSWLNDHIWTIDYVAHRLSIDYTTPPYRRDDAVPLNFDRTHRYPRIDIEIDGTIYHASLDTGATVALSDSAAAIWAKDQPRVRGTSFVTAATLARWHAAHPDWTYIENAGIGPGVSLIRVPQVRANHVYFRNVWFSTRPRDDVFHGSSVDVKLGASAFGNCAVMLDYVHDVSAFQC